MEFERLAAALATQATLAIELAGMAVIIAGALIATAHYGWTGLRRGGWTEGFDCYRANLGRGILLGLEMLVAADIIKTVSATLDLEAVAALAVIVLIRTFLSFSLEVEIKGHWPWKAYEKENLPPRSEKEVPKE